jgi:hypothetical protein
MIVFINGAFGVGKTTVAKLIRMQRPDCRIFDPEVIGAQLKNDSSHTDALDHDFQDLPEWRTLVIQAVKEAHAAGSGPLLIPMTVWRSEYLGELSRGFSMIDRDVLLLRLTACEDTLRTRILGPPEDEGPHAWCLSHLEVCLRAFANPLFGQEVATDNQTPTDVARVILQMLTESAAM